MAYNQFTIDTVRKTFGLEVVGDQELFSAVLPMAPSAMLRQFLDRYLPLGTAIGTEKARSEFIIAPILAELTEIAQHHISLFSGIEFNVDEARGLNGRCDFLLSASPIQYSVVAPIFAVVEAKNENLNAGLGQCMAEMVAAQLFNRNEGHEKPFIYGTVTTGSIWRFLKLQGSRVFIDKKEYFVDSLDLLLGVLKRIVQEGTA
jgi:hypothetical protein